MAFRTSEPSEKEREWHDMLLDHYKKLKQARGDQRVNSAYSRWAAEARARWERDNVVWFYGMENGKAIWGRDKPGPELLERLKAYGQLRTMDRVKMLAEQAAGKATKR